MTGRESKLNNDIFFVCSLIENIGRMTKNHRSVVANSLGRSKIKQLLDLADVYHSDNIEKVSNELMIEYSIHEGNFDNITDSKYSIPTIWDIGKVYKRLIVNIIDEKKTNQPVDALLEVYNSWISRKLEDYNSSLFYENSDYIFQSYKNGDVLV